MSKPPMCNTSKPAKPARKRPAKKKTPAKKKPATKKKVPKKAPTKKKTPKKSGQKKPAKKRRAKGKPTGVKKPIPSKTKSALPKTTSAAACKYSPKPKPGTKKPNSKLQARIDPDPCRSPSENEQIMIENYKIASAAAAKKYKPLQVNHMYLFLVKQGPKLGPKHHAVVVGKVMKVGNQLGMEATMQQLGKPADDNGKAVRHENAKVFCGSAVGGVCNTGPYRRIACGWIQGKYKFVAGASVEFADPEHFIQKGTLCSSDVIILRGGQTNKE
ncbi:hypothetical protein BU23DRAFT_553254 [Bimuria novae-zelandiae CBS 107.79]|uniref:Uncharacterized protein n=1 Tax=Bimuria novae-zelandiae CBS 107.79 TaxID=1447943 RepID=A0A6A5VCQ0_9PLEO|nr:hypothetical protein BU23DRAFT_553254 [Bimuria novae-zelandiae CBS 107.79]